MRAFWRHVAYNWRQGGLIRVLEKIVFRFRRWLWWDAVWLIYRVDAASYNHAAASLLKHRVLDFATLVELGYSKALDFPEATRQRLDRGSVCHGFFVDGELANTVWTTAGLLEIESGVEIIDSHSAGIIDSCTVPALRSKGIYRESLTFLINAIRQEGIASAMLAVDPGNIPSIKGIERAGFQPLYQLRWRCRFGRRAMAKFSFEPRYSAAQRA
jgi:GNAT superfamily N-acetyltransferase